ncbi:MAG TPA: hypothetical protein VIF44_05740 [Candidatus Limnocylindrales bacterium]|jgi:hypothetical protein
MAPPTAIWPGVKAIDISSRDGVPSPIASAWVRRRVGSASAVEACFDATLVGVDVVAFGIDFAPDVAGALAFDARFDRVLVRAGASAFGAWLGAVLFGVLARLVGFVVGSFGSSIVKLLSVQLRPWRWLR